MSLEIRVETARDLAAIHAVHVAAFGGPGEARLVDLLRGAGALTVSLVAEEDGEVVGHVALSPLEIVNDHGKTSGLALAPVGVLPAFQGRGVGSRLIESGIEAARQLGWEVVIVLGHHDYYPRFGFVTAEPCGIRCPFEVPAEAFMVLELQAGTLGKHRGMVKYHAAFASL